MKMAKLSFKSRQESILAEIRCLQSLMPDAFLNIDAADRESRTLERKLTTIADSSNKERVYLNDKLNNGLFVGRFWKRTYFLSFRSSRVELAQNRTVPPTRPPSISDSRLSGSNT
eukprot:95743_1